jgi:hypothetical protein
MVAAAGSVIAEEIQPGRIQRQEANWLAGHDEPDLLAERWFECPDVRVDLGTANPPIAVGIQMFPLVLGAVLEKGQVHRYIHVAGTRDEPDLVLDEARQQRVAVGGGMPGTAAEPDQRTERGDCAGHLAGRGTYRISGA